MDQQINQHRVLKFQTLGYVSGQIRQKIIDLRIIVLLAHDAGDQTLRIKMEAHQLKQLANHFAELDTGAGLQPQPDRLEGIVQILGVAEIKQIGIFAIGVGNKGLTDAFIVGTRKTVEQHYRTVTIKTGQAFDRGDGSGLQCGKGDRFKLTEHGELFNRKSGF